MLAGREPPNLPQTWTETVLQTMFFAFPASEHTGNAILAVGMDSLQELICLKEEMSGWNMQSNMEHQGIQTLNMF